MKSNIGVLFLSFLLLYSGLLSGQFYRVPLASRAERGEHRRVPPPAKATQPEHPTENPGRNSGEQQVLDDLSEPARGNNIYQKLKTLRQKIDNYFPANTQSVKQIVLYAEKAVLIGAERLKDLLDWYDSKKRIVAGTNDIYNDSFDEKGKVKDKDEYLLYD